MRRTDRMSQRNARELKHELLQDSCSIHGHANIPYRRAVRHELARSRSRDRFRDAANNSNIES